MFSYFSIIEDFQLDKLDLLLAFLTAFLIGISKAGIKGITILSVTALVFIFGAKASTGIMLPLLIAGDIFAVIYYNRHAEWKYLIKLLPWMIVGVLFGVYVGKDLPETIFKQGMAVIILLTVLIMFWWDRKKEIVIPDHWWFAAILGLAAGFTTMLGNLAGAFSNLFFLSMRVPKNTFIGTAAWLFFFINIFKLPFHILSWETITYDTLKVNLLLIPALVLGLIIGVWLVKKIKDQAYRNMILVLTALGAIVILFR